MTRTTLVSSACLLAAPFLFAASVLAQTPPSGAPPSGGPPPGGQSSPGGPGSGPGGADDARPYPAVFVTSVEVLRSDRSGGLDLVRARGVVTSKAWGGSHLVPISQGPRADGVLDLLFQAHTSGGATTVGPFMVIEALLPVSPGHPYKAVRVRGASNALTLKALPGFVETPAPKEDCAKCVGKFFQARGSAAPSGAAAGDIVKEEDLPYKLRVIRPADGVPHYDFDPNRLTLVLGEDNKIVDAAWD